MTKAVLFDVDGTLIDSNDQHARAWVAALAEAGYTVPFERVRPLIGMGGDKVLPELVPGLTEDSDEGKAIAKSRVRWFMEHELQTIPPTRGARELLEAVRKRGAQVVVATSAKKEELDSLLARGNLGPLIDMATTSDDAEESKPDPDIIGAALKKAGVRADEAVMVGDTQYDIEAAHKAGVACVALVCGGNPPDTLREADAIYADPAELIGALDRPPFVW
ncbi:MAG: hydrolase, haloacid dehalogenase-like family [Candidatus Eremiobacteraeota bacterium]|nr:hydrolase, haloacid dehalogenase-like family [Candidatus Eremiobacteraeota bacterium]